MTKKKKRQNPEIDDLLARPWCYYCERDFDDLKILIHHQKAKHFKCERCARRLNTAGGLRVHMEQVHKETLEQVENALPGRESIDLEIFGTEGIPESEVAVHHQRILAEFTQKEVDRRAASGHFNGPKKPKIDISKELDPAEIKKKLEAHKKAMASGGGTPITPGESQSPGRSQSPGGFDQTSPPQSIQAHSPPSFAHIPFGVPPPYPPATFPPQPVTTYPPANFSQGPYPPQPSPQFGRGVALQVPYTGYQQPTPGFGAPKFTGLPANQFSQAPPTHVPTRHLGSSLPQPHQVPGLPPKPNIPGLPPRPAFTAGFGRGNPSPVTWTPPPQQHGFIPVTSPSNVPGFSGQNQYLPSSNAQGPAHYPVQYPPSSTQPVPTTKSTPEWGSAAIQPTGSPKNDAPVSIVDPSTNSPSLVLQEPVAKPEALTKPKRETKLVYNDNEISPEEKRALLACYAAPSVLSTIDATA